MRDDLAPKMDKLNKEKREFEEHNTKIKELEESKKLLIAFRYYELRQLTRLNRKSDLEAKVQELTADMSQFTGVLDQKRKNNKDFTDKVQK